MHKKHTMLLIKLLISLFEKKLLNFILSLKTKYYYFYCISYIIKFIKFFIILIKNLLHN